MKKIFLLIIFIFLIVIKPQQVLGVGGNCGFRYDSCNSNYHCEEKPPGTYKCVKNRNGGGGGGADFGGGNGTTVNVKCNCTTEFGACGDKFGKTNIQWRECKAKAKGAETCKIRVGLTLYQIKDCDVGTTGTPTPTPIETVPTPTPIETVPTPTDNPNCKCKAAGTCKTQCQFDKFSDVTTYSTPIKCGLADSVFQTAPTEDNKTSWCRAEKRTKGDADGDGSVTYKDYFYYVTAKLGFKIPPTVNPDFNGDDAVNAEDGVIIIKSLKP